MRLVNFLAAATFLTAIIFGTPFLRAEDTIKSDSPNPLVSLNKLLHAQFVKAAGLGTMSASPSSNDEAFKAILNENLSKVFTKRGRNHHTFSTHGPSQVPIEIAGLSMNGPHSSPITEADKLNGIDSRVFYSLSASAHRTHSSKTGWSEWKPGKPILMSGIFLERKKGKWYVTNSPTKYFSAQGKSKITDDGERPATWQRITNTRTEQKNRFSAQTAAR